MYQKTSSLAAYKTATNAVRGHATAVSYMELQPAVASRASNFLWWKHPHNVRNPREMFFPDAVDQWMGM